MKVTASGPPGSGKSSVCRLLCERFGFEFLSAGDAFRALAEHMGITLKELGELAEKGPKIDQELDRRMAEMASMEDNVLVDGRLAAFTIKDADLKFYLNASPQERARRVAGRDDISVDDALRFNTEREISEKKRYMEYYGIDPDDLIAYDLVVNTDVWDAGGVATIIASGILALMED